MVHISVDHFAKLRKTNSELIIFFFSFGTAKMYCLSLSFFLSDHHIRVRIVIKWKTICFKKQYYNVGAEDATEKMKSWTDGKSAKGASHNDGCNAGVAHKPATARNSGFSPLSVARWARSFPNSPVL